MKLLPYIVFWVALGAVLFAFAPKGPADAARTGSPRYTTPCTGGPPDYCADSTQDIVGETPLPAPPVNTPFRDPDFGSRMVRVTDANTLASWGSQFIGFSFMTDASAEANVWSAFDPAIGEHGGYRFVIYHSGGGRIPFVLDATTMRVTPAENTRHSRGLAGFVGTFSFSDPHLSYGIKGKWLTSYNVVTGKAAPIYDITSCPNLPAYVLGYGGSLSNSGDDTKFADYFGGKGQGDTTFVVYYDRTANSGAGACYWYDTESGMVGGTNTPPMRVAGNAGQMAAPPAPTVTAAPGSGNLPAGDYYVRITTLTRMNPQNGETTPSPEVGPVHLPSPGSLRITLPQKLADPSEVLVPGKSWGCLASKSLAGCSPFNVYIGASPGSETRQNPNGPVGGVYVQSDPLKTKSPGPPAQSTAGYNVHNARLSKDGIVVRVNAQQGGTIYFWKAGTNQVLPCRFYADDCGGHQALGYDRMINDPNDYDMADVMVRPLSNPSQITRLVNPLPMPRQFNDSHWSWNDANSAHTMPVCGSFYNSHGRGDGTQNVLTNPRLQITAPYDGEIVCVATSGPSKVWRFAHNRAAEADNDSPGSGSNFWETPRGNVSPDGRFYMFTSNWDWNLGSRRGSPGCPQAGACRTDVFIVELH
ncbi:MAG: hypothetical protein ACRD1O_13460 [Terriglobia bacterium]